MIIFTLTSVSNSLSMGYLAYLACIESWIPISDKVIITDGWSKDRTIENLFDYINKDYHSKIEIIKNKDTYWSHNYQFHIMQLSLSWDSIIKNVDCDWLIVVNADYVYHENGIDLKEKLLMYQNELVVKFNRYKSKNGLVNYDDRGIIINIRKMKKDNISLGFALQGPNKEMSDFPSLIKQKSFFIDSNGNKKTIHFGELISRNQPNVGIECGVYGHFFFTNEQCLYKCRRWSNAIARYYGTAFEEDNFLIHKNMIYKINNFYSKEEVMSWKHPPAIKKLFENHLNESMMGMMKTKTIFYSQYLQIYYRIKKKILTKILRVLGLQSLENAHNWVDLYSEDETPSFDLRDLYEKQNKVYRKIQKKYYKKG